MNQVADAPARLDTPFALIGGEDAIRRLSEAFYDLMERDPAFARLRAIHAPDLTPMRARLADWLTQWMGGPKRYAERHPGRGCIVSAHAKFPIDAAHAADWMACMRKAFQTAQTPEAARAMIDPVMENMCQGLRNDAA